MSEIKPCISWTEDQQDAIDARAGSLIVSAAAGSGKTAVLVERIIQRLTDDDNPCDADKLLIVTFTRAATAEMRSRLQDAIEKALSKNPFDGNLQKQQMLLPSANIYTIDAFCSNLVRENFDTLGISADFSPLDENESKIMQHQAAGTVIENLYEEGSDEFKALVELLFAGRDDSSLEENILNLYTYSRAYPSPDTWLKNSVLEYNENTDMHISPICGAIKNSALDFINFLIEHLEASINMFSEITDLEGSTANELLKTDLDISTKLKECFKDYRFDDAISLVSGLTFQRWNVPRGFTDDESVVYAKNIHTICKDTFKDNGKGLKKYVCETESEMREDLKLLRPIAEKLVEATLMFDKEYYRLKVEKNVLDFSDIELLTLKLLVEDPSADIIKKTQLAKEIENEFEEILIDEYQDTNMAQDMIFCAISRDENNMFTVGDVKQSIYGFRQAMPEIFLARKNTYKEYDRNEPIYPACVTLGKNFRSRKGVTEYINFVFSQLMSTECGGVKYDEAEKLVYGASYDDNIDPETELHVLSISKDDSGLEKEAEFIASYIAEKVENHGEQYKDFAILLQTATKRASQIEKVLKKHGIPTFTEAGSGFLETTDIQIMISILRIIDNPLQDVPLVAFLLSPIAGFTTDEISLLRVNNRNIPIYSALLNEEIKGNEKCAKICNQLRIYRNLSVCMPAGQLIRKIYEDTELPSIAAAMENGTQRTANLYLLQTYADNFDKANTFGIAGFIRYLDKLYENGIDPAPATVASGNANVVRIMSIHKSKGLEFKYCILADTAKRFNKSDQQKNLILHSTLGIGLRGRELATGNTYPTLIHTALKLESEKAQASELMRVLYVALTRAKEKLVIIASTSNKLSSAVDKAINNLTPDKSINPYSIRYGLTFFDWILMATIRHPSAKALRDEASTTCSILPASFNMICQVHDLPNESESTLETTSEFSESVSTSLNEDLLFDLENRLSYSYPYLPLANVASKRAASGIHKDVFTTEFFASAKPEFKSQLGLTPAQRGTSLHKFMQYADYEKASIDFEFELSRLLERGFISKLESKAVDKEKVIEFTKSEIAKRISQSENVMREKKFSILLPAGSFDESLQSPLSDERVLVQGIADCVFEENGKLVIIDYKTDRTRDINELIMRHKPQLEIYVKALSQSIGKEVAAAYIYSFSLGREIKVI